MSASAGADAVRQSRAEQDREPIMRETGPSGLGGRPGGDSNIEEFIERRWLTVNPGPAHYPY
jgi:benzaldehyde dehydrogenase (NAD)